MTKFILRAWISTVGLSMVLTSTASAGGVELHAHLFMKQAMSWAFRGDFFGPLQARDWRDKFSSMANPESMNASDLSVVVVSLYAHPLFSFSMRDSIRQQIKLADKFVRENPQWVLALDSYQAERALADGKRVLILSLEGASGILETDQDLVEFIDKGGIRIVTLLHLTDDQYGGVALLKGLFGLSSPVAFLKSFFNNTLDKNGVLVNAAGLTEKGRAMARALVQRHVWIDLAHASDQSQRDLVSILGPEKIPLLYTHTVLRRFFKSERAITDDELKEVKESNGIIGLMPSDDMLVGTPLSSGSCQDRQGSIDALTLQMREAVLALGPSRVALGSDYNGGVRHLHSSCHTGTSLDEKAGLWNIGQSRDVWRALGANAEDVTKHFLEAWGQVQASHK